MLSEGGTRPCKICAKVRLGGASWSTAEPPAAAALFFLSSFFSLFAAHLSPLAAHHPRPAITTQTFPLTSFSPAQLRKGRSACEPCCSSRAARGADHDATSLRKSAKEVRAERKAKRKREEEEARALKKTKETDASAVLDTAAIRGSSFEKQREKREKKTRPTPLTEVRSNAIDFGAVARFDPDARGGGGGSDSESDSDLSAERSFGKTSQDVARDDDDDGDHDANDRPAMSVDERALSGDTKKAAEAQLRKRQIYLGGVPFHKTEDEIRAAFEEESLPVEAVDCMTFPDSGRFRGIAILTFATREAAKGALAWNGEEWDGTFLTVKKYAPKERREDAANGGADGGAGGAGGGAPRSDLGAVPKTEGQRLAFACNLSWDVTEETLRAALAECAVTDVRMGVDKQTGHFRGFAHVEFATDEDLERAVALNGASVLGRPMKIAYATARKAAARSMRAT